MGLNPQFDSELMQAKLVSIVSSFKGSKRHSDRMFLRQQRGVPLQPEGGPWKGGFFLQKVKCSAAPIGTIQVGRQNSRVPKTETFMRMHDFLVDRDEVGLISFTDRMPLPSS